MLKHRKNRCFFTRVQLCKKPYCFQNANIYWVSTTVIPGKNTVPRIKALQQNFWRMSHKPRSCFVSSPFCLFPQKPNSFGSEQIFESSDVDSYGDALSQMVSSCLILFSTWLIAGPTFEITGYIQNMGRTRSANIKTETVWKKILLPYLQG